MQCVHNFIHAALVVKTDGRVAYRLEPYFLRRWAIRSTALISSIQACSFFVSFAILLSLLMWRLRFAFQESMIFPERRCNHRAPSSRQQLHHPEQRRDSGAFPICWCECSVFRLRLQAVSSLSFSFDNLDAFGGQGGFYFILQITP